MDLILGIKQQANLIPPVADMFTDLDPDLVPVTVTEDEAPNPAPRAEPTPTPTETVEMALASLDDDKVDPKKYQKMFSIPRTYQEAVYHPCEWQQNKWQGAADKEYLKMKTCKVWTIIDRKYMKPGRVCTKFRWVFDIKRDGTFRLSSYFRSGIPFFWNRNRNFRFFRTPPVFPVAKETTKHSGRDWYHVGIHRSLVSTSKHPTVL
jgi:hypothetical protein